MANTNKVMEQMDSIYHHASALSNHPTNDMLQRLVDKLDALEYTMGDMFDGDIPELFSGYIKTCRANASANINLRRVNRELVKESAVCITDYTATTRGTWHERVVIPMLRTAYASGSAVAIEKVLEESSYYAQFPDITSSNTNV